MKICFGKIFFIVSRLIFSDIFLFMKELDIDKKISLIVNVVKTNLMLW